MQRRDSSLALRILAEKGKTRIGLRLLHLKKQIKYKYRHCGTALTHVTCYVAGNAGDTALSECVRRTLDQGIGPLEWKLQNVKDPVGEETVRAINTTAGLLIGGGGLFLPDSNANTISGWQWACSKESLSQITVPVILYSVGYNYFRGQEPSELFVDGLNAIVEKSAFVGLRNHGSMRAVRALLREDLRNKVCYQPCTTTLIRKILPNLSPKKERGAVAFNFAFDRSAMRYGDQKDEIIRQIVQSMYVLRDRGYKVILLSHRLDDLSVLSAIHDRKGIHIVNAEAWDLDKLARFYNGVDVVLGMRGHAQMIPFGANCQIISLGSHEKLRWFLEDIGAEDWYVELTQDIPTLADRIIDKFIDIHEVHGKETMERLLSAQQRLYDITMENMESIRDIMAKRGGVLPQ